MGFSLKQILSFGILGIAAVAAGAIMRYGTPAESGATAPRAEAPAAVRSEQVAETAKAGPAAPAPSKNYTEYFAARIGKDIISRNVDGPVSADGQNWINVPHHEEITAQVVKEALAAFDPKEFRVPADESRVAITEKNDAKTIAGYLRSFQAIIADRFGTLDVKISEVQRPETLDRVIAAYDGALEDFYALEVPEILKNEHLEEIALIGTQREIFARMKNYEADPLGAILAMSTRENIDKEFAALKERIVEFVKARKIVL